jgi:geranylgeranyl diphosphate synthase type II
MKNDFIKLSDFVPVFNDKIKKFFLEVNIEKHIFKSLFYSIENGGKRLRPYILYNIGINCKINPEVLFQLGIALEILHTSSLIHDDLPVIDDSDFRRGNLSNHKKFDEYLSLLTGDYGFLLPIKIISDLENINVITIKKFTEASLKMIEGETVDVLMEKKENYQHGKNEIIDMYAKKTGALFGAAFSIPFYFIGKTSFADEIYNVGEKFGVSFQIFDDMKDIFSTKEELGKEVNADINKKTIIQDKGVNFSKSLADKYFFEVIEFLYKEKFDFIAAELKDLKKYIEKK